MEYNINRAGMYILYYVEIAGSAVSCIRILYYVDFFDSGDFFQSRLQCKSARAAFL